MKTFELHFVSSHGFGFSLRIRAENDERADAIGESLTIGARYLYCLETDA